MAKIVLGVGTTHGPLLSTPPEAWDGRADVDKANPELAYKDGTYNFEQLYDLRKNNYFVEQNRLAVRQERHARCQSALDKLGDVFDEVKPDVVVIVGDDQHEWFNDQVQPSFAIFCASKAVNYRVSDAEKKRAAVTGRSYSIFMNHPADEDHVYDVKGDLATHMVSSAMDAEFDVSYLGEQPKGVIGDRHVEANGDRNIGHAFGFVARRLLRDRVPSIVPVLANTYYPPNQPTPKRCYEFGKMLGEAISSWDENLRVAICASGGMSHTVIDEELDERMIKALKERDEKSLFAEPNIMFRNGTSEIKNWIITAGALSNTDFDMNLIDYVPCYRSEAGTGSGMAFATWQ